MYLPRNLISHLFRHLVRTHHALSPPVLILAALDPDALCACRILTALLKRDYIPHKIQPILGYEDLSTAGLNLVRPMKTEFGGCGGVVVCLGVGGLVDLAKVLGLQAADEEDDPSGGVEVWLIDARRPWNLGNVFGGNPADMIPETSEGDRRLRESGVKKGCLQPSYKFGQGGIIVFDDGDIEEDLAAERESYYQLLQIPEVEDDGEDSDSSGAESDHPAVEVSGQLSKKRKTWSDPDGIENDSDLENGRPRQRRRSSSVWKKRLSLQSSH